MKRLLLLFLLLPALARAQEEPPPSLFFSPEEAQRIERHKTQEPAAESEKPRRLFLESLLYFGPNDWTVWLGGRKWTPATKDARLRLIHVERDRLSLTYKAYESEEEREISLLPHQSFDPQTGEIFEGP